MIKKIELWDFESHEHTVIDNISTGLNLICGKSNSGKTAIVRALKLACWNVFDPKSVRIGATKCSVLIETERGTVKVTRGNKCNLWEVTKIGQPTQYFDKVGVSVVPEAADVIGLKMVKLGDIDIPVNIMDQLESHFMLAGIGDKSASGSMRAEIVDEISGLSGIEGLIKSVGLDIHRSGREISETEVAMEETRKQLHPEDQLKIEEATLTKADEEVKEGEELLSALEDGKKLLANGTKTANEVEGKAKAIAGIPDTVAALSNLKLAGGMLNRVGSGKQIITDSTNVGSGINNAKKGLGNIPDIESAGKLIEDGGKTCARLVSAKGLHDSWEKVVKTVESSKRDMEKAGVVVDQATGLLRDAKGLVDRSVAGMKILVDFSNTSRSVAGKMLEIRGAEVKMITAEKERDEILKSVTVCPLNLRPVSKECMP